MPIISKSATPDRGFIVLSYEFSDGVSRTLRIRGKASEAEGYLLSKESGVLASKQKADLDLALEEDSNTPSEDVTQTQLYKAWMTRGFLSDDPIEAHKYLSKVAPSVLALGLTAEELAGLFDETVEMVANVLIKWQYLDDNADAIAAYKVIKDGI